MSMTDSAAGSVVAVVRLTVVVAVAEAYDFVVEAFLIVLVAVFVVVSVTELKCSPVITSEFAAAPKLLKVVAVDYSPDLSCVHVAIDIAVFFWLVVISLEPLQRDGLCLSVRMF